MRYIKFERHVFRQAFQRPDEAIDEFITRLQTLSKTCQFGDNIEDIICDQVIEKCASISLRRRLLREESLTLQTLLPLGHAFEQSERLAAKIENSFDSAAKLNAVSSSGLSQDDRSRERKDSSSTTSSSRTRSRFPCSCCGNEGHRAKGTHCPGLDLTCRNCGKLGALRSRLSPKTQPIDVEGNMLVKSTYRIILDDDKSLSKCVD